MKYELKRYRDLGARREKRNAVCCFNEHFCPADEIPQPFEYASKFDAIVSEGYNVWEPINSKKLVIIARNISNPEFAQIGWGRIVDHITQNVANGYVFIPVTPLREPNNFFDRVHAILRVAALDYRKGWQNQKQLYHSVFRKITGVALDPESSLSSVRSVFSPSDELTRLILQNSILDYNFEVDLVQAKEIISEQLEGYFSNLALRRASLLQDSYQLSDDRENIFCESVCSEINERLGVSTFRCHSVLRKLYDELYQYVYSHETTRPWGEIFLKDYKITLLIKVKESDFVPSFD